MFAANADCKMLLLSASARKLSRSISSSTLRATIGGGPLPPGFDPALPVVARYAIGSEVFEVDML